MVDGLPDLNNADLMAAVRNKCNVVINMKIPDNDLINARKQSGWDPLTGKGLQYMALGWTSIILPVWKRKQSDPFSGKSISFLNEQLAYEDGNDAEDEMDDEAEEVDIILDRFEPEKLVKTCSFVNIPEDTDTILTNSLVEYEKQYMQKVEELISNVKAGYKGSFLR